MPLLNEADTIYAGALEADRVYMGATLVWPPAPTGAWGEDEVLYGPGSSTPGGPSDPNTFMVGTRMSFLADGRITHFRYWRHSGNPAARYVAIWSDTGTLLASATTDGGTDYGWLTHPLTTPLAVTAGQIIRSAFGYTGSAAFGSFAFDLAAPPVPSGTNIQFLSGVYTTPAPADAWDDFPDNTITPNHYYGDVVYQEALDEPVEPTGPAGSVLTTYAPGGDRNDFTGEVGVRINTDTVQTYDWIGLLCHPGNSGLHRVNLYEWFSGSVIRFADIDLTGKTPGTWVWAPIAPITSTADGYWALLKVTTGGDGQVWYNEGSAYFDATEIGDVYATYRLSGTLAVTGPGAMYVGLDLGWS